LRDVLEESPRAAIPALSDLLLDGVHRLAEASGYEIALDALALLLPHASQLDGFVRLLASRSPVTPGAFTTVAKLRGTFAQVSKMSRTIFEILIGPASQQEDPPVAEMLELVAVLKGGWVDVDWLMETGIEAIDSLDWAVNRAAVRAMIRVWREMPTPDFRKLMATYGERTVEAVLAALADALHKEVVDDYLKLLRKMWLWLPFGHDWREMVIAQIAAVFGDEPEPGFYAQFVEYLREAMQGDTGSQKFRDGFVEFLIMAKKMSPGDDALFAKKGAKAEMRVLRNFAEGESVPIWLTA
jgi:hypothetical protein